MVPSENPYLFALPKAADCWIPAQKVLSKFAKNADLENPSTITSNKLRKQIASIMQILNLDEEAPVCSVYGTYWKSSQWLLQVRNSTYILN